MSLISIKLYSLEPSKTDENENSFVLNKHKPSNFNLS